MTDVAHPQPLGIFGFPAGLMVVPGADAEAEGVRRDLLAGRLPARWPDALRVQRLTYDGDEAAALAACTGDGPLDRYHRWLLDPAGDDPAAVRAALPAGLRPLVDVAAATIGAGPAPADVAGSEPEVAALALAAGASEAAGRGEPRAAAALLSDAAVAADPVSPVLAAVLRGSAGLLRRECADERAADDLAAAAAALAGTDLAEVRAELLLQLGSIAQERAAADGGSGPLLQQAMHHYYDALQLVGEETAPHLWAALNMNLATAHLASPMSQVSDQLRLGVATQALRAARRVFTPEQAPVPWSTATLNLANALVYTPSTHQGDNLVEAVELYEEVLASGVREHDPAGKARLLANQGNALAHLGAFDHAKAKLVEARYLFETEGDHSSVMAVRGVLDEIAKALVADPDDELADLARQAEQMARMPRSEGGFTSGMGVTATGGPAGDMTGPPPKPTVTVLRAGQTHPDVPVEEP
ncbi:hypothetical protein [Nocardioides sp. YIM 152588]|uniref:hypothetical protein n=1 Tax=Nocardioides sp. YIM 152588 TaxID=3158259 RepID=UPI0032E3BDAD